MSYHGQLISALSHSCGMKYPPGREDFLESSHPDGHSFSYATSSIQLCAILFQRSPNHILTVELYFHRLVVIQINHAHKSIHTFFCQPADVRFLAGLFCQNADFFIQFIGTLLFFLFCPYANVRSCEARKRSLFYAPGKSHNHFGRH